MNRKERRRQERLSTYTGGMAGGRHGGSKKGYHMGCFGKSHAENDGYKPLRFKKDFTVDRRSM